MSEGNVAFNQKGQIYLEQGIAVPHSVHAAFNSAFLPRKQVVPFVWSD